MPALEIVAVNRGGLREADVRIKGFGVLAFPRESTRRSQARQWNLTRRFSGKVEEPDRGMRVFKIARYEPITDEVDLLQFIGRFGDDRCDALRLERVHRIKNPFPALLPRFEKRSMVGRAHFEFLIAIAIRLLAIAG